MGAESVRLHSPYTRRKVTPEPMYQDSRWAPENPLSLPGIEPDSSVGQVVAWLLYTPLYPPRVSFIFG